MGINIYGPTHINIDESINVYRWQTIIDATTNVGVNVEGYPFSSFIGYGIRKDRCNIFITIKKNSILDIAQYITCNNIDSQTFQLGKDYTIEIPPSGDDLANIYVQFNSSDQFQYQYDMSFIIITSDTKDVNSIDAISINGDSIESVQPA